MSDVAMILARIGATLRDEVAPALEGRYAGGHAGMAGMLAIMASEAYDGAADRLHRGIEAVAGLLRAGGVDPGETSPASLKISDLTPLHDRLSAALISLQAELERRDDAEAKALNAKIWGFLASAATERMPSPPRLPAASE